MARALLNGMLPPAAVPRGEQYSLAALLYHFLTGRHYAEFPAEQTALLEHVLRDAPLPFSACGHAPWPDAERALARALARDPAARHADVAAFAGSLCGGHPPPGPDRVGWCRTARARHSSGRGWIGSRTGTVRRTIPPPRRIWRNSRWPPRRRGDPDLLASADLWITRAQAGSGWPTAALAAATHHARGDRGCEAQAIAAFLAGCGQPPDALDFLDGRAGMLWAAAHLLRGGARHGLDTAALAQWARRQAGALWRDIDDWPAIADCVPLPHLGLAHGWAGLIFATLFACPAAGMALPAGLGRRLDELAALGHPAGQGLCWPGTLALPGVTRHTLPFAPGWCSGSAGFVWLWAKAYEVLGVPRFLDLAIRAGRHAVDTGVINPDLCCGMTGQGFAGADAVSRDRRGRMAGAGRAAGDDGGRPLAVDGSTALRLAQGTTGNRAAVRCARHCPGTGAVAPCSDDTARPAPCGLMAA
ncbi:lanthionine synthetase LanC family protein [Paracoccus sp. DMF-8]|uniref:lanthionine synthetase LanC family protein n=1 Tax=Paracoccus sp. DMF-8 TaxID=3019445 RepID=UPI0023E7B88D|nr:lanthionine synthetase LanC family protein [Paracoccus sp. DMF-8]MDF3605813.1 lanthionine synthetase LanC family protein [Paracoccus sp. DMF-8]